MFTLIKSAHLYTPEDAGFNDVLIANGTIAEIGPRLEYTGLQALEVIDAQGKIIFPGLIDGHVHIAGAGGEGGYLTRTPEISVDDVFKSGITTVVGLLGADAVTRSLENLLAKARELELNGLTTYIYTGSYQFPAVTITGSVQRDILLIDKVIGVGEIAISDHRSFFPSKEELIRLAAEARSGGLLTGKAGIVHFHVGDDEQGLELLTSIVEETPMPPEHFVVTHVNRHKRLFDEALKFAKGGGYIDITADFERQDASDPCVPAYEALQKIMQSEIDLNQVLMSSDGNGSKPTFDSNGKLLKLEVCSCEALYRDLKKAVLELKLPIAKVLQVVTSNPARALKIDQSKGSIRVGADADLVIADNAMNIEAVYARGKKVYCFSK